MTSFYDFCEGDSVQVEVNGEPVQGVVVQLDERDERITVDTHSSTLYDLFTHEVTGLDDIDVEGLHEYALETFEHAEAGRRLSQRQANGLLFS